MQRPLLDKLKMLENLQPDSPPLWGVMTAQHMVEHLILAVKISSGKVNAECFNPPEKLPTLKRFLMSARPMPKNYSIPSLSGMLLPLAYSNLKEAKNVLEDEINCFYSYFEKNLYSTLINPTFGELNKEGWDIFHEKHFKHHFEQFGIIK